MNDGEMVERREEDCLDSVEVDVVGVNDAEIVDTASEGFEIRNETQEETSLEDAEEDGDEIGWYDLRYE